MQNRQIFALVLSGILIVAALLSMTMIFENLDASQIMVIQSPVYGDMTWHKSPGIKWQGFGKVTDYQRRSQFWFSSKTDQGKKDDESLRLRFNDGGHANASGGISWEMPLDDDHLNSLHQQYGSTKAIEQQLVRPVVEKVVYMTGPLMSSTESYASRRNELLHFIEDQIQNGIYATRTTEEVQKDPVTGLDKKVSVNHILLDKGGLPQRAEESPLSKFGIKVFNLTLNEIKYETKVEEQIAAQQSAVMKVQISIMEAKAAEQRALTSIQEGKANAAQEEWKQKAIAAKAEAEATMKKNVAETEAAQKLEVARLDAEAAKQFKLAEIARGEGEASRRKSVMEADGALKIKLDAYVEVQKAYAEAIGKHHGPWVPTIVMGQPEKGGSQSSAQTLIELITVKAAKDLELDMSHAVKKPAPPTEKK